MKHISSEEFETRLNSANELSSLIDLVRETSRLKVDEDCDQNRLFEKSFSLISNTQDAASLWRATMPGKKDRDQRLLERMLRFATTHADLDDAYACMVEEGEEIQYRSFIRRIFDLADSLDYPKK